MENPLVAIHCITYNQAPYIAQCLDGFVMQKTTFPFVAIVHDDASIDGTADIVREYAQKYPDIIHPIFETENQYSKQEGMLASIMAEAIQNTGAKYVAMCEGDDYWIDPQKLQKQVDFLEANPDYSMCYHNRHIIQGNTIIDDGFKPKTDIIEQNEGMFYYFPTMTMMYLNCVHPKDSKYINLDIAYWTYLSSKGKIRYMDFYGAVYRIHDGGMWNGNTLFVNYTRTIAAMIVAFNKIPGINKQNMAIAINNWIIKRVAVCKQEKMYKEIVMDFFRILYFTLYSHQLWHIRDFIKSLKKIQ